MSWKIWKEILQNWWATFVKIAAVIGTLFGVISALFPLSQVMGKAIWGRVLWILLVALIVAVIAAILVVIRIHQDKNPVLMTNDRKYIYEYLDITQKFENQDKAITLVVPINTSLDLFWNQKAIKEASIHGQCIRYFERKGIAFDIDSLETKEIVADEQHVCRMGDWFLYKPENSETSFLFIATSEVLPGEGGLYKVKKTDKSTYVNIMQRILTIAGQIDDKVVYIPLIGTGNQNNSSSRTDVLDFIHGLLKLNLPDLKKEVHIVVDERVKKEVPIFTLQNM